MNSVEGSHEMPEDSGLARTVAALAEAGHWVLGVDGQWRLLFVSEDMRRSAGAMVGRAEFAVGAHMFGLEAVEAAIQEPRGANSVDMQRSWFASLGPLILGDTPGGRSALRELVHPELRDIVDGIADVETAPLIHEMPGLYTDGSARSIPGRCHSPAGQEWPSCGRGAPVRARGEHEPDRGDDRRGRSRAPRPVRERVESSETTRRGADGRLGRLDTAVASIVDCGLLLARPATGQRDRSLRGRSRRSRRAARRRSAVGGVAHRSGLDVDDVQLRFGLHWGATLYVGNITTAGRSEVTALGDEVNETARIEACATGGRTLASQALLERLDNDAAADLGLDPDSALYRPLADLTTATDKARRDAPNISVSDIT